MSALELGLIGGAVSGMATTLGATFILLRNTKFGKYLEKVNMDFVIGLMLAAAALSLILPAYESTYLRHSGNDFLVSALLISFAVFSGVLFIKLTGKFIELVLFKGDNAKASRKALLFVIAMMVHNFPEGLASGASMTLPGTQGYTILGAIAIQNVPEGFTTALSFLAFGMNPVWAFLGAVLTGVVELVGGIIGGGLSGAIEGILPYFMAFAGGAMMNVVLIEIMEKVKNERYAFFLRPGFIGGIALIVLFNNL